MELVHNCPQCGKPMVEQPDWPGLWLCPDYVPAGPVNSAPPYRFECTGSELTAEGEKAFGDALFKEYLAQCARDN